MEELEERVAAVKSDQKVQLVMIEGIRTTVDELRVEMNRRFDAVDLRFDAVNRRFDQVDDRMSRQFLWLVGILVATLAAIVIGLPGR